MKTPIYIFKSTIGIIILWCSSFTSYAAVEFLSQELIDPTLFDIQYSRMVVNRRTGNFEVVATLSNTSAIPLPGPLYFAVDNITSSNVTVINFDDISIEGIPYFILNTSVLNPDDVVSLPLKFYNPDRVRFTFKEALYGSDRTAPLITVVNPATGSTVNTTTPAINLSFSDLASGVDINTFKLIVNGIDVTSSSTVTPTSATYTPANPLAAGTVNLTASISDNAGNLTSVNSSFVVSVFRAIADCAPTSGQPPLTVKFRSRGEFSSGSIVRFRWDFEGDGVFDTNDTVALDYDRTFSNIGTSQAVLEVTNNFGDIATDACAIQVTGKPPVATATASPSNGPVPLDVTFTGSGNSDGGTIVLHEWDLDGDGIYEVSLNTFDNNIETPTSITLNINHASCNSGTFNLLLNDVQIGTGSGSVGCTCNSQEPAYTFSDSALIASAWNTAGGNTLTVSATSGLYVAYIKALLVSSTANTDVCLYDNTNSSCVTRSLCNGYAKGGTFSALAESQTMSTSTITHTYTEVGTVNAKFRVTDDDGETDVASVSTTAVRVGPPGSPSVSASATPVSGNGPLAVSFDGSATDDGAIVLWEWDFDGDGTYDYSSSSSPLTSFTYVNAGVFAASLRATDNDGLTNSDLLEIKVAATATLSVPTDTFDPDSGSLASINTTLNAGSHVKILIKDKSGFVRRTLVDKFRVSGTYSDQWDGRDDAGFTLPEGPYYAILEYLSAGEVKTVDLTNTTGGDRYNPSRSSIPSSFSPFAGNPLNIDFTLMRASEVTAFIGRFNVNTRLITFLERIPLGRGTHRLLWNGENSDGQLIHPPPGDRFLFGIWGYNLPANVIYLQNGAHVSSMAVSPPIFDPSGHIDDLGTPLRSIVTFNLSKTANIELTVADAESGQVVARRFVSTVLAGTGSIEWDGKDDNGVFVAPGRYRLGVAAFDENGYRSMRIYALQRVYY